jgi:hypothetical protein
MKEIEIEFKPDVFDGITEASGMVTSLLVLRKAIRGLFEPGILIVVR